MRFPLKVSVPRPSTGSLVTRPRAHGAFGGSAAGQGNQVPPLLLSCVTIVTQKSEIRRGAGRLQFCEDLRMLAAMSDRPLKTPRDSAVEARYIVMPQHANDLGIAFGGTIMSWIDMVAAMVAQRHCARRW